MVLGKLGSAIRPYLSEILNFINDDKQEFLVRGYVAIALNNIGITIPPQLKPLVSAVRAVEQSTFEPGCSTVTLENPDGAATIRFGQLVYILKAPEHRIFQPQCVAVAASKLGQLTLAQVVGVLSPVYEEEQLADEWRFYAYFFSGGDNEVKRLLRWVGKPKQLPDQLNHDEGVKALEVFQKVWEPSKDLPEVRNDLANKTATIAKMVNWQPQDLPLLKQHYDNLKNSHPANADSVQAAINSLETWKWLSTFRTVILAHIAFWLALIFAYPRSPQIQALFFWNPWVRNILGVGYVSFLLTWIPFLRRKLFQPFQPSLLADAGLTHFTPDLYFPNSNVQIGDGIEPIASALPHLKGQIILEGDSGLGKTMFVRHLLKQSKRIAVYLPAPTCTEGVIEAIQKKLHGDEIKDAKFLQSLIYSGAIDIYIDGLNEVSADTRAKITQFVANHFRGNILITTQPLEWDAPGTAKTYKLQPLQLDQIEAYLRSRHPAKTAKRQGTDYTQACQTFLQTLTAPDAFAPEERKAVNSILSNPMELTLAAWLLADNQQPNLLNLRQQQYDLMASDYQRMWNHDFPLLPFSEAIYQLRLSDQQALPADKFFNELQCMEDEKYRMVISRQWQDAKGEAQKEWVFRHDKIAEFFIVQTFLGNSDEAKNRLQSHIGDSRFRGVYFLLATLLPIDAAQQLREDLINYAADTKDHTVSDTFVQLMRSRKTIPVSQQTNQEN